MLEAMWPLKNALLIFYGAQEGQTSGHYEGGILAFVLPLLWALGIIPPQPPKVVEEVESAFPRQAREDFPIKIFELGPISWEGISDFFGNEILKKFPHGAY